MTKQLIQTLLIMSSKEKLPFKLHNLGSIFNQHSFKEKIDIDKVSPLVDEKAEKWVEDNPAINAFFRNASQEDNIPSENQLYVVGGYDVATTFLDSIWERDKDKGFFSDTDFDYFSQYCGYLTGDPASIDDWRECYLQLNGIKIPSDVSPPQSIDKHLISYHDAFEIMRMQAEWHYREFGFEFPQLLALLDSMIENPQSHIGEWILWQQAVQSVNPSCKMDFCKGFSEVISSDFDRNKTLDELEQDDWGEPNYGSFLVTECYRLRRVPLRKFTAGNLRILIGQNISLKYLIPLALEQLDKNPFVEGDYYDGDLLLAVIGADPEFWKKEPHLHKKAVEIAQRALCAEYKKQEDFDTEINLFQELIDFVNKSGFATYQPKSWGAIRRFEELIDAADEGKSISEEELSFILEVIKTSPDDYELGKAITILGKCGDSRYQKILEPFIRYPTF